MKRLLYVSGFIVIAVSLFLNLKDIFHRPPKKCNVVKIDLNHGFGVDKKALVDTFDASNSIPVYFYTEDVNICKEDLECFVDESMKYANFAFRDSIKFHLAGIEYNPISLDVNNEPELNRLRDSLQLKHEGRAIVAWISETSGNVLGVNYQLKNDWDNYRYFPDLDYVFITMDDYKTFTHELGHFFGLDDIFDINHKSSCDNIMSYNCGAIRFYDWQMKFMTDFRRKYRNYL